MGAELGKVGKSLWRSIAANMGIIDPKVAPGEFKTDQIIPVVGPAYDVGWAQYGIVKAAWEAIIPANTNEFYWWLTGGFNTQPTWIEGGVGEDGSDVLLADNADFEIALIGWFLKLAWNDFGTGDNGQWIGTDFIHSMNPNVSDNYQSSYIPRAFRVDTTNIIVTAYIGGPSMSNLTDNYTDHDPMSMAQRPIWIPAGVQVGLGIHRLGASNFPYDIPGGDYVTATGQAWGVKVPKGIRPPML